MLDENLSVNNRNYVALGSFDGLHKGHITLINKILQLSKEGKGKSIVYTFKNHPRTFIKSLDSPKLLLDNNMKSKILMDEYGIDLVYYEDFNEEFMNKSPEEFIQYICRKFDLKGIVVGFNYKFGYKNTGNVETLKLLSEKYNYELYVMDPCEFEEDAISSTRIRNALSNGEVEKADYMLDRPYFLKGEVVKGRQIGRQMGFPTANLHYNEKYILPKEGVYYTNVIIDEKKYKSITSIGNNPTVNGKNITVETFLLNFDRDIYGSAIQVHFIKKIRDNFKFNSLDELRNQLERDKAFAEKENYM